VTDVLPIVPVTAPMTSVLICDDRPAVREVLTGLLAPGASVVAVAAGGAGPGVLAAFAARPAGLVLIGVYRGSSSGPDAVDVLLGLYPWVAVIVFGGPADAALLVAAMARGARGLMLWDPQRRHRPTTNRTPRGPAGAGAAGGRDRGAELTQREVQVLHRMCQGQSNSAIGQGLFLSEDTVKTHARRLYDKLGARDRAHAVALGLRAGLIN
jgi:DNA-binding NarL/FixJ family response regulator